MGFNRRNLLAVVFATSALLVAAVVWADPFGADFVRVGFGMVLEPGIVLVEFLAFLFVLKLKWTKALGTSFVANAASFAAGWVAAAFLVSQPRPLKVAVGFVLLLAVEVPIVVGMNRSYAGRRRLVWTAVMANLCTYIAARAIVLGSVPD